VADPAQDDPAVVRREYETDAGLAGRKAFWERRSGPQPIEVEFREIIAFAPRRVLEVGCGGGELAERLVGAGIDVVAVDQSEFMVELTRSRGVPARVADVQDLPFGDDEFDVATANHMLYHVPDLHRGLRELARVAPRLVAATNGYRQLAEMWELVGRDLSSRERVFYRENGESFLREHYRSVRMIDSTATLEVTADDMRGYIATSIAHKHLAAAVPDFAGTMTVTLSGAVFVAER
jgi:SAM-dependent methyltransferase